MKSKTFVLLLLSAFFAAMIVLASANIFANATWSKQLKSDWKSGRIWGSDAWAMIENKTNYISQKGLSYNAFLFGGSKSGAIQPRTLKEYTGDDFYNYWTNGGCFENYEMFCNHILKTYKDINEVIICLSSHEVEHFKAGWKLVPSKIQKMPFAYWKIKAKLLKEKYLNINTFTDLYKKRNTENLEPLMFSDGGRDCSLYFEKRNEDEEKFIKERVLPYWHLQDGGWEKSLHDLFYREPQLLACDENIAALKRIKANLDARGIKLTIVIMPTFVAEIHKYTTPQFTQYLKDLVAVQQVWNFSGLNDIDLNPYNFSDGGHCFDFVGDKMIETMYSPEPNTADMDSFGILLTSDNIGAYIESQREKWRALKAEYDKTGAITLQGKTDASYLAQ